MPSRRNIALSLLVAIALGCPAATAGNAGWRLDYHSDFFGPIAVLINKKSMQLSFGRRNISFLMTDRNFKVLGINHDTKTYCYQDYGGLDGKMIDYGNDPKWTPRKEKDRITVKGLRAIRWLVNSGEGIGTDVGGNRQLVLDRDRFNTELIVTNEFHCPSAFAHIITFLPHVPSNLGFPLSIKKTTPMGVDVALLKVSKVSRVSSVPNKVSIPKGYREVDTEIALLASAVHADPEQEQEIAQNGAGRRQWEISPLK